MVEVSGPAILDYLLDLLNCQGLDVVFHDFELEYLPRHLPWALDLKTWPAVVRFWGLPIPDVSGIQRPT